MPPVPLNEALPFIAEDRRRRQHAQRLRLMKGPHEGQVVGQSSREFDMELNPCKEKELSNMRSRGAVKLVPLTPPHRMSLEAGLEYIGPDELVEATPQSIRLRKRELKGMDRRKIRRDEEN